MPVVSDAQRHKVNRDPIRDPHIVLLEFQEDGQAAVNRAAINTEDVIFQGEVFDRAQVDVILPETGGDDTSASLVASNVDRILSRVLDAATQRINCRIILVDVSVPDVAIIDTRNLLVLSSASATSEEVNARLGPRASLQEPVPNRRTTRQQFPGVWLA